MPGGDQFARFYPGLVPEEERLWRKFLREHELEYDEFLYNVRVGEGINIEKRPLTDDPELDRKLRQQFREATQKRIDVLGVRLGELWIFEVEVRPGTQALGQLVFYRGLLPRMPEIIARRGEPPNESEARLLALLRPQIPPTTLAVVSERMGFDNRAVFEGAGVRIFLFP